jgi:hypothetical protein
MPVTRAEVHAKAAAKRDEMFRRICADARLTPAQLVRLPAFDLLDRVRRVCPGSRVDEGLVPVWAAEFAKRAEKSSPCP